MSFWKPVGSFLKKKKNKQNQKYAGKYFGSEPFDTYSQSIWNCWAWTTSLK